MRRKVFFREQIQSFLIVSEGEETEPLYFRAFRVPGDVRRIDVKGLGRDPVNLVKEAVQLKAKGDYDQVWVVFDIDDTSAAKVNAALQLADDNGIAVAYSNQAFELWYLLHFHYFNTATGRDQYTQKLSDCLGQCYKKNHSGMYLLLLRRQADAIQNAKRLLAEYDPPKPAIDNPSTTVFRLVEELNRFSPDSRRS